MKQNQNWIECNDNIISPDVPTPDRGYLFFYQATGDQNPLPVPQVQETSTIDRELQPRTNIKPAKKSAPAEKNVSETVPKSTLKTPANPDTDFIRDPTIRREILKERKCRKRVVDELDTSISSNSSDNNTEEPVSPRKKRRKILKACMCN